MTFEENKALIIGVAIIVIVGVLYGLHIYIKSVVKNTIHKMKMKEAKQQHRKAPEPDQQEMMRRRMIEMRRQQEQQEPEQNVNDAESYIDPMANNFANA
jgi:cytochrome b subunit of formate dehydrogenase